MRSAFIVAGLLAAANTSAAIVDYGTYFQDTDTGLYWLKVTETRGISQANVSSQFGYGGNFEGWRYATMAEVEAFLNAQGVPPQGNSCATISLYCGTVAAQYEEALEDAILLLGDTQDAWLDLLTDPKDVDPDGAGRTIGIVADEYSSNSVWQLWISDAELVNRSDGSYLNDGNDQIFADHTNKSWTGQETGSFLVRTTDPSYEPPPPWDPDTTEIRLLDNLNPTSVGIGFDCGDFYPDPYTQESFCGWDDQSLYIYGFLIYTGEWITADYVTLYADKTGAYEWQQRPWVRVTGYDYKRSSGCAAGDTDLGSSWCRTSIAAPEWVLATDSYGIEPMVSLPPETLDNIELEFVARNVTVDFDPWNSTNEITPKVNGFITIQVNTSSIADGDEFDFDASTVDPATVRAGINGAELASAVLTGDYDGDGDTDYIFGFRTEETGVSCLDTIIGIAGKTYAGEPFHGNDSITPIGCEETVNIDVDPFNDPNVVRPNDSYNVTVAILGSRTALGAETDLYPGTGTDNDVNVDSLKFGPAETPNTAGAPVITDINSDSLDDVLVSFNAFDAGIACGDTELEMTGEKVSGIPIEAMDSIVTEDCDTGCHP